jgi:transcriptional regulator with XRE-family HTH domain
MPTTPKRSGRRARAGSRFPSEAVADNIRAYRLLMRLSQGDLAKRMRAMGYEKWSQATVSEVERYGRTVAIDELFPLAQVLEATPADLLDPQGPDGRTALDVDLGPSGVMNHRIGHAWVRDNVRLRLEWTGEGYEAGSLTMIDKPGHEGTAHRIMLEQYREVTDGMTDAERAAHDALAEAFAKGETE